MQTISGQLIKGYACQGCSAPIYDFHCFIHGPDIVFEGRCEGGCAVKMQWPIGRMPPDKIRDGLFCIPRRS